MEEAKDKDFYWEGSFMVFTAKFHLRRGSCCGSGCRHCPYEPRWTKGNSIVTPDSQPTDQFIAEECQA